MNHSLLKNELFKMIEKVHINGDILSASIKIDPEFFIFKAHFPDNPVLPGFCQIQLVLLAVEKALDQMPALSSVKRCKFYNIVKPNDLLQLECSITKLENGMGLKAKIRKNQDNDVKISFINIFASLNNERCEYA